MVATTYETNLVKLIEQFSDEDACREYIAAKELDICPLRILESMNHLVLDVARETKTPAANVRQMFEELGRNGIPGGDWFVDHVHPSIRGYQAIGDLLAGELQRLGWVHPVPSWSETRDEAYARHLASLDTIYFAKGQQHLEALTIWAQGRVKKDRPTVAQGATP